MQLRYLKLTRLAISFWRFICHLELHLMRLYENLQMTKNRLYRYCFEYSIYKFIQMESWLHFIFYSFNFIY